MRLCLTALGFPYDDWMLLSSRARPGRASQTLSCSLAVSVIALGLPAGSVHAQTTTEATQSSAYERAFSAYLEADFSGARRFLEQAQQDSATRVHELAQSYALLGLLMDIEGGARAEVETQIDFAVSVDASVSSPDGASRSFRQLFEQVRAARQADPPTIEIELASEGTREGVARVTNVPEGLVAQVQLVCEGSTGAHQASGRLEASLELGAERQVCTAEARTAEGHVLFLTTRDFDARTTGSSDDTLWIVLGVVGGVILVGGAVTIGVIVSTPRDAILGMPTVTGWTR